MPLPLRARATATLIAAALLSASPAVAATPTSPVPGETAIPFISRDGILDFRADGNQALWIRSATAKWYHVTLMQRCIGLASALSLGFQTSAADQLDRFGAVIVEGRRCPVQSLVRSDPPPRQQRGR